MQNYSVLGSIFQNRLNLISTDDYNYEILFIWRVGREGWEIYELGVDMMYEEGSIFSTPDVTV
jgi:hypothetical protein